MKADIHPDNYQTVVFEDLNNGQQFFVKSTAKSDETIKLEDGQEYPLIKVHITSASHPFYTGQEKLVDVEGRVDKFNARRKAAEQARQELAKASAKKSTIAKNKAAKKAANTDKKLAK